MASAAFHTFSADADEFRSWLADKAKTAGDESYRDLTNLERKLQKHEAFECELRSNEGRLRDLNKVRALHFLVDLVLWCLMYCMYS